jgi:23S rRNA pseudouridine1911/1915/1917 synthase
MTANEPTVLEATVEAGEEGSRLDRWLARKFPATSRARFQALIAEGRVAVEGLAAAEARKPVKLGERVEVILPAAVPAAPRPEPIPLAILYEDEHLIVIDKPAGLVVHPAAGHESGTLVNALIAHCGESLSGINGIKRPGIVHRLDKDTSGLMVIAKTDAAHRGLASQFAAHGRDGRLVRAYLALVWGALSRKRGAIDAPLGRSQTNRQKISVSRRISARHAVTHYEVLESLGPASLLRCELETGRTHQIRVHMAHIGHPLLGDKTYGSGFASSQSKLPKPALQALIHMHRQALHAAMLGFEHPINFKKLRFESPLPQDLEALLLGLRSGHYPAT